MPTSRHTTYNQFDTPTGAVGEAPDGPGAFATLADEIDGRVGNAGGETVATTAARDAIPAGRLFNGKEVFVTADKSTWKYMSGAWILWSFPRTGFTADYTNVFEGATPNLAGYYKVANGDVTGKTQMVFTADASVTGTILFNLPFAMKNTSYKQVGNWLALDNDQSKYYSGALVQNTDASHAALAIAGGGGLAVAAVPFTWTVNDCIWLDFRYEIA